MAPQTPYIASKATWCSSEDLDVSIREAEADLARAQAREKELRAELATVEADVRRLESFLEMARGYGLIPMAHAESSFDSEPDADELAKAFRGKSIPDAAMTLISLMRRPLTEEEIVAGLRRGGVTFVSDKPELTLRFALLRKRKETAGLIKDDGHGTWGLTAELPEVSEDPNTGFVANRARNDHAERSRLGLMAARQRGVKNGRRSILTPELKAKTNRLLASKLPARQIAAELGIAAGTLYKWQRTGVLNDTSEEVEVEPVNRAAG